MRTLAFPLLFMFIFLDISSQVNDSKVNIGLSFNPHLSGQTYYFPTGSENLKVIFDTQVRLGWTAGVSIRRTMSDRISFQTGIYLSTKGYASHYQFQLNDTIIDLLMAEEGKYPKEAYSKSNHYFYDVPLALNWLIYNGHTLNYYANFGLITNIYVAAEGLYITDFSDESQDIRYMHLNHGQLRKDYMVRMLNLSGFLAIGIERSINSSYGLFLEPNFDMSILPLHNSNGLSSKTPRPRYYNIGIRIGILFC